DVAAAEMEPRPRGLLRKRIDVAGNLLKLRFQCGRVWGALFVFGFEVVDVATEYRVWFLVRNLEVSLPFGDEYPDAEQKHRHLPEVAGRVGGCGGSRLSGRGRGHVRVPTAFPSRSRSEMRPNGAQSSSQEVEPVASMRVKCNRQ